MMTLTLTIEGADALDNGQPARIELDRHGAVIGRSAHADWSLPDTRNLISSRHCEISFRDEAYLLTDLSTNGTYLNGSAERLRTPHRLAHGDRFTIGHYAITASAAGGAATIAPLPVADENSWESFPAPAPLDGPGEADPGWADPPDPVIDTGSHWRKTETQPAPAASAGTWDLPAPVARPSAWSSEPRQAIAPTADDVWGRLSEQSEIDWSRGNFAAIPPSIVDWSPIERPAPEAAEPAEAEAEWQSQSDDGASAALVDEMTRADAPGDEWQLFVDASGLPAARLNRSPAEVLVAAGALLRQLVGGLMLMIDARARAKAQLGVQATGLELDGNNPLKFVRSPERALLQLLDAPERGFMPAGMAVEDAYQDLQAHQMATLGAMRGALEGTLSRFSPGAIRDRVGEPDGLARWFPMLHRAHQWDAYERDFEGVVRGADDAFMDLFAKEFRQHYDRHIGEMKARRRKEGAG